LWKQVQKKLTRTIISKQSDIERERDTEQERE